MKPLNLLFAAKLDKCNCIDNMDIALYAKAAARIQNCCVFQAVVSQFLKSVSSVVGQCYLVLCIVLLATAVLHTEKKLLNFVQKSHVFPKGRL